MPSGPRWIALGKVLRTHGLRGAVKVYPYGETLEGLAPGALVYVDEVPGRAPRPLTLGAVERRKGLLIVGFRDLDSIALAEALVGHNLSLPETLLPPTDSNEYYHFQLLGLAVRTGDGVELGTLTAIFDTGPHDVYAVTDGAGRELLLPAVAEVIREVNLTDGYILAEPPAGLIDDL